MLKRILLVLLCTSFCICDQASALTMAASDKDPSSETAEGSNDPGDEPKPVELKDCAKTCGDQPAPPPEGSDPELYESFKIEWLSWWQCVRNNCNGLIESTIESTFQPEQCVARNYAQMDCASCTNGFQRPYSSQEATAILDCLNQKIKERLGENVGAVCRHYALQGWDITRYCGPAFQERDFQITGSPYEEGGDGHAWIIIKIDSNCYAWDPINRIQYEVGCD